MTGLNPGRALDHYRQLELRSRLDNADPHALVAMLYDELLGSLDVLASGLVGGRNVAHGASATRAAAILTALSASLDGNAGGGELASSLDRIYRAATIRLRKALDARDAAAIGELRAMLTTLAEAWRAIRSGPAPS